MPHLACHPHDVFTSGTRQSGVSTRIWSSIHQAPKAFSAITIAKADGNYIKLMEHVAKLSLFVLDDWVLAPMTDVNRRDLLEIIDDRYQRSSTLITSQLPAIRLA